MFNTIFLLEYLKKNLVAVICCAPEKDILSCTNRFMFVLVINCGQKLNDIGTVRQICMLMLT